MKRRILILSLALIFICSLIGLAACKDANLDKAKLTLEGVYQGDSCLTSGNNYDLLGKITVGESTYVITWTVDVDETKVKITPKDDGNYSVTVIKGETAYDYALTATIANDKGVTVTAAFDCAVPANTNQGGEPSVPTDGLAKAKETLETMYKNSSVLTSGANYTLTSELTITGDKYTVTWSANVDETKVKIVEEAGSYSVVVTKGDTEVSYVLTATVTDANQKTIKVEFAGKIPAKTNQGGEQPGPSDSVKDKFLANVVDSPVAGQNYYVAMYYALPDKVYYAKGSIEKYKLQSSENVADAAVATIETTTGGFYLKLGSQYLTLTTSTNGDKTYYNVDLQATASTVFKIGENKMLVGTLGSNEYTIGTYQNEGKLDLYTNMGASDIKFTTPDTVDVTQFPVRLIKADAAIDPGPGPITPPVTENTVLKSLKEASISNPTANTNYALAMYFGKDSKVLYAIKDVNASGYVTMTDAIGSAAIVTVEPVTGGFYLAISDGTNKSYFKFVDATQAPSGTKPVNPKAKIEFVTTAAEASVFTVGDENVLFTNVECSQGLGTKRFYLGSHGAYDTLSATSDYYITDPQFADKLDTDQYVARLVPADLKVKASISSAVTNKNCTVTFVSPQAVNGVVTADVGTSVNFTVTVSDSSKYEIKNVKVNGNIITGNGNYTVVLTGNMTITVELNNLNVVVGETYNATASYTGSTTGNLVEGSNNASTLGLDASIFTVDTNGAGSYSNKIGVNKDGTIRLYGASDVGNILTISVADGYRISKVTVTITHGSGSADKSVGAILKIGDVTGIDAHQQITLDPVEVNGQSVQIANVTGASKQIWISSIVIEYQTVS